MASATPTKKERGCFQCSRRRIVCDRTEPSCLKCAKKRIECSGLGRIRFAEGIARRGRLKDCKVPKAGGNAACLPTTTEFQTLQWAREEKSKKRRKADDNDSFTDNASLIPPSQVSLMRPRGEAPSARLDTVSVDTVSADTVSADDEEIGEIGRVHDELTATHTRSFSIEPWIAPIDPKLRMLFSYFSETVAPAMVVLDDSTNGYRSLVLPMALEDDLLRRAVGVVAAQHLSRRRPELRDAAETGRAAVISRLRSDSMQNSVDRVFNKFTWATLIVLLVGETVTGSADFPFFVQMLLSLSMNNPGRNLDANLLTFLQAQTHMFELLGVPLLGEEVGVLTMMKASETLMDFLSYQHLPEDCEDRRVAELIRRCFVAACNMYTRCAASADGVSGFGMAHDSIQQNAIEQLIALMSQISPSARGAHALVWVCFVAGAASTNFIQREFFVHRMEQVYARTQFRNIPSAIQGLRNIWSRGDGKRWTVCLPQMSNVLVM